MSLLVSNRFAFERNRGVPTGRFVPGAMYRTRPTLRLSDSFPLPISGLSCGKAGSHFGPVPEWKLSVAVIIIELFNFPVPEPVSYRQPGLVTNHVYKDVTVLKQSNNGS